MEPLFENGHQDIGRDGDPNLGLHGVLGGTVESFDAQVLLDPLEEQLDPPSRLVEQGDVQCRKGKIVGQKREPSLGRVIEVANAPERIGIIFRRLDSGEIDELVAPQPGGGVDGKGVTPVKLEIVFGARDIESGGSRQDQEPGKIDVASVHHVEGAGLGKNFVEDVDVVHLPGSNADKGWNAASQVQKRVQFDGGLVLAELRPGKQRQA